MKKAIVILLFLSILLSPIWGQSSRPYWGVESLNGKEILPLVYERLRTNVKIPGYGWGNIVEQNRTYALTDSLFNILTPFYKIPAPEYESNIIESGFPFRFFVRAALDQRQWPAFEKLAKELSHRYAGFRSIDSTLIIAYTKHKIPNASGYPYKRRYGLIDTLGNEILAPAYDELWMDRYGFLLVENKEKKGLIDRNGKELLPCVYDEIDVRWSGYATVKKDRKAGLINNKGKFLVPLTSYRDVNVGLILSGKYLVASVLLSREDSQYILAESYTESLRYGIIDTTGQVILPFEYDRIGDFEDGIGVAQKEGEYAFINLKAEFITPFIYEEGSYTPAIGGYGIGVRNDISYCVDSLGHEFFSSEGGLGIKSDSLNGIYIRESKSWYQYYYDLEGNPIKFKRDIPDSLFRRSIRSPKTELKGFADGDNKIVIPCKYDGLYQFQYGLSIVQKKNILSPDGYSYGVIDIYGKEIIPIKHWYVRILEGGKNMYVTNSKNKVGFFNREGKQMIPFKYTDADPYYQDYGVCKVNQGKKCGLVDTYSAKEILPCVYDYISMDASIPDYIIIEKDGKTGLAKRETGEIFIPCIYKYMTPFKHNLIHVMKDNDEKWSIMKLPEKKMLTDMQFDDITSFGDKYLKVKNNNLYGIIDLYGNIVIPIEYTEIKPYNVNYVLVKKSIIK